MVHAVRRGGWVDSVTREQKEDEGNRQSLGETLRYLSEIRERNAENDIKLNAWKKHQVNLEHPISPDDEVLRSCNDFLEAWKAKNYGALGSFSKHRGYDARQACRSSEGALLTPSNRRIRDRGDR